MIFSNPRPLSITSALRVGRSALSVQTLNAQRLTFNAQIKKLLLRLFTACRAAGLPIPSNSWPSRPFGWLVCTLLLLAQGVQAGAPAWWQARGVIQTNATPNDYAALNAGQLKQLAFAAWQELEAKSSGAGFLPSFTNVANNYAAINVGQLKEVARPFYDRLIAVGTATNYPWANSPATNNYAIANIGQAKNLFSFSAVVDTNVFLIIDLSGGFAASAYPVSYMKDIPAEGWTDEYKTSKMVLRKISAGTFMMGNPNGEVGQCPDAAQYTVTLTKDFYIGVFEVTQRQWELVMGNRPSYFTNNSHYATRPVEQVSYCDIREKPGNSDDPAVEWPSNSTVNANSFMGRLRTKTGLWDIDLPTEAQWEYACRAGTTAALNSGANLTDVYQDASMASVGRYYYNGDSGVTQDCAPNAGTATVGSYPPNAWGLYDMHGNVLEWCLDWYGSYPGASSDPLGAESHSQWGRVLRGGAYWMPAFFCRSAARSYMSPETALDGFRIAKAVLPNNMYFVAFAAEAGTVSPARKLIEIGMTYGTLPVPTRPGHSFGGWWTASGGTGSKVTESTTVTTDGNHTLYAEWTQNSSCTVSFNAQGWADTPTQKSVTFGDVYGTLPSMSSTNLGYSFGGWWTGADGMGSEVTESTVVATDANHTLYAKWVGNTYRVSHNLGYDAVSPLPTKVTYGKQYLAAVPVIASRPGYTIGFWWTGPDGTGTLVTPTMTVAKAADHTLYAKWIPNTYTVNFFAGLPGGSMDIYLAPKTGAYYGAAYGVLPVPSRAEYSFGGWWTALGGTGSEVTENTAVTVAAEHILYAKWIVTSCTVVFAAEGGTVSNAWRSVNIRESYGTLPVPSRTDYSFGGWWTEPGGMGALVTGNSTVINYENHVIYAKWTQSGTNLYLVVDLAGGSSALSYPVSYLTNAPAGGWTDEYKTSKLVLRRIPAGTFMMGLPSTSNDFGDPNHQEAHPVTLTKDYYIGVFEITQNQWERVMGVKPGYFNNAACYATRPVEQVSYYDIREKPGNQDDPDVNWPVNSAVNTNSFMGKLRAKTGLTGLDLPTEAQWEYACRAGTTTALNSGTDITYSGQDANMAAVGRYYYNGGSGASQGCSTNAGTAAAGTCPPNAWGLYDLHGNVLEWTLDGWGMNGTSAYPLTIRTTDPAGVRAGTHRLLRGGSWSNLAYECSSAYRLIDLPSTRSSKYGFRVVSSMPKADAIDTDADGMPDEWETSYGLHPNNGSHAAGDPDGDGVTNLQEFLHGSSPRNSDSDNDGLSDSNEVVRGTSPYLADTDGDRMSDGWEVQYGLDPLVAGDGDIDSDSDGLRNWYECLKGTNPFNPNTDWVNGDNDYDWDEFFNVVKGIPVADSDGNGISDEWEARYLSIRGSNGKVDPTADFDGDGADNLHEYKAGTDPTKSDTDGDGIRDGDELFIYYTNPTKRDTDGDGLSDDEELFVYYTNPLAPDTDGDGLFDGEEVKRFNTDPNAFSSDGSGRADIWSILGGGTDPNFWPPLTEPPAGGLAAITVSTYLDSAASGAIGLLRIGGTLIPVRPGAPSVSTVSLPSACRSLFTYTPGPGYSTADQPVITVTSASRLAVFNDPGNRIQLKDCFSPLRVVSNVQYPSVFVGGTVEFPPYTVTPDKVCLHDPDRCELSLNSLDLKVRFVVGNDLLLKYIPRPPPANSAYVDCTITYTDPLAKIFYVPFPVAYCHCQASGAPSGTGTDCFCNCCHVCCRCWVNGCTCTPGNCRCSTTCNCADDNNCSYCGAIWGSPTPDPSKCGSGCAASDKNCHDEPDWGNKCFTCPKCGAHRCGYNFSPCSTGHQNKANCACLIFPHAYECPCSKKFPDALQRCPCDHTYKNIIVRQHKVLRVGTFDTISVVLPDGRVCCPNAGCFHNIDKYSTSSVAEMKGPVSVSPLSRTTTGDFTISGFYPSTQIGDGYVACKTFEMSSGQNDLTYILQHYTVLGLDVYPTSTKHAVTNAPYWLQQVMPKPPEDAYLLNNMLNDRNAITFDSKIKLPGNCGTVKIESTGVDCYLYVKANFIRTAYAFTNLLSPEQRIATLTLGDWKQLYCDPQELSLAHLICTNAGVGSIKITFTTNDGQILVSAEQKFTAVRFGLVPDYDRDGKILEADCNLAKAGEYFRLWINDDNDVGNEDAAGGTDIPGQTSEPNCKDVTVNGRRDLLDFFPVLIDVGDFERLCGRPDTYRIKQASKAVNIVFTSLNENSAGSYLSSDIEFCGTELRYPLSSATILNVGDEGFTLSPVLMMMLRDNGGKGVFLVEGVKESYFPLVLEAVKGGQVIFSSELPMIVKPVEEMFERANIRGGAAVVTTGGSMPPGNGKHVIFLHGFRVPLEASRAWGSEIFKRLRQSGSNARFYSVTWYGDDGMVSDGGLNYNANVVHAFDAAPYLSRYVDTIIGNRIIMAHSLGNMVVSSAIADRSMAVNKYFMFNAAVPAEAFDVSQWSDSEILNPLVSHVWSGYQKKTWCAKWHELFVGRPNDDRQLFTWENRFAAIPSSILYNYYSTGDHVLSLHEKDPVNSMYVVNAATGYELGNYAWQKQELFKGRAKFDPIAGFGATDVAGWGFHSRYVIPPPPREIGSWETVYSAAEANGLDETQLRSSPVFYHEPQWLLSANSINIETWNSLLALAIPALSGPAGSRTISFPPSVTEKRNFDMNTEIERPNGWGRTHAGYGTSWMHGDLKDMAYFYNSKVYEDVVEKGGLK